MSEVKLVVAFTDRLNCTESLPSWINLRTLANVFVRAHKLNPNVSLRFKSWFVHQPIPQTVPRVCALLLRQVAPGQIVTRSFAAFCEFLTYSDQHRA